MGFRVWSVWGTGHVWPSDSIWHDRKPTRQKWLNEQALRESNHEGDAMASVPPAQPMHKAQVLRPPVETEEVFFIRKCVGHRMRSVLFEGPGEQVWHSKTETSSFPTLWGPQHRKSSGTWSHVTPGVGDVPKWGNSFIYDEAEDSASDLRKGPNRRTHRTPA